MHVLYSFPFFLGRTGIGNTAAQQVAGLARKGARVTVCCGSLERAMPPGVRMHQTLHRFGVRLPHRVVGVVRACAWHDTAVAARLRYARERFDVVHCWPGGSLRTIAECKRLGIPSFLERPNTHTRFAYEVVNQECARLNLALPDNNPHRWDQARLDREEAEFALSDFMLCPSDFVAQTFRQRGFSDRKLVRHRYGYDPATFQVSTTAAEPSPSPRVPPLRPGLKVAFVGSCEPRKGLHFALRAWVGSEAAEHGSFEIAGSFMPGYRERLLPWLRHPSVREIGFVSDPASVMHRIDCLVLPSIEEGSALVTYEARAAGCVLLVSEAAGAPCSHGVDGLIHAPGDVATLREHLDLLATDPETRRRLARASREGAGRLTWDDAAEALMSAYRYGIEQMEDGKCLA